MSIVPFTAATKARLTKMLAQVPEAALSTLVAPLPPQSYARVVVQAKPELELIAARWREGGNCVWHGHSGSAALYRVVQGTVQEERFMPEGDSYRYETATLHAGECSYLPPGSFHRVEAQTEAITVHGYSPAPDEAREEISMELMQQLEEIKRQTLAAPQAASRHLPTVVTQWRETWARREEEAVRLGQTRVPVETLAELRASGVLGAPLPTELGGWDTSLADTVQAIRLLAQYAPATALALAMPLGNAATARLPEEVVPAASRPALRQHKVWLAEQIRQGKILAVANSEPGAGGDLANTKTLAQREGNGYHLTGRKSFATFGPDADYFLCAARRTEGGRAVVDGFFVPRHAPGLTLDECWNPIGMKPTASVGLRLESAPAAAVLGYPGCLEGVSARHWSTLLFAAVCLGMGEGALREAVAAAGEAVWARAKLADFALQLDAAAGFLEALTLQEVWPFPSAAQERARRAKTFAARVAVETATHAAMISGGRAYTPHHPAFRLLCDALAGPLIRPPLPQAMDAILKQMFPPPVAAKEAA